MTRLLHWMCVHHAFAVIGEVVSCTPVTGSVIPALARSIPRLEILKWLTSPQTFHRTIQPVVTIPYIFTFSMRQSHQTSVSQPTVATSLPSQYRPATRIP